MSRSNVRATTACYANDCVGLTNAAAGHRPALRQCSPPTPTGGLVATLFCLILLAALLVCGALVWTSQIMRSWRVAWMELTRLAWLESQGGFALPADKAQRKEHCIHATGLGLNFAVLKRRGQTPSPCIFKLFLF